MVALNGAIKRAKVPAGIGDVGVGQRRNGCSVGDGWIAHAGGDQQTVRATGTLVKVEGRRLTFIVEARNEREKIGEGTHQRVVVKRDRLPKQSG